MGFVRAGDGTEIYYEDIGEGPPIVFVHGWPLSGAMWEYQVVPLFEAGFRCITFDRRGFGRSGKSGFKYDYTTLAGDVAALLDQLDVRDATLVGFSMGGGEVVEYLTRFNDNGRVVRAALVSSIVPFMLKTEDNPDGIDAENFEAMLLNLRADRPAFITEFTEKFFGVGLLGSPVSTPMIAATCEVAMQASPLATMACVTSFSSTDFLAQCQAITVPVLVIHGDGDDIVPIAISGKKAAELIPNAELEIYEGAPHGLHYTERLRLAQDLAAFASEGRIAIKIAA